MPTVLRLGALRVVIYPNDHRPAHVHVHVHVHVMGGGGEAVFILNCPDGPLELREAYGFTRPEASRIGTDLGAHLAALCSAWSDVHGRV